jgi:DNA mismatch endonuclease (patch repair protein)
MGFRFRVNRKDLPGKPDIVLPKYRTVIFVHGCFWHRHKGCKRATMPSARRDFWSKKLRGNVVRDEHNCQELRRMGWHVVVVWECEVRADPVAVAQGIARRLGKDPAGYVLPEKRTVMKVAEKKAKGYRTRKRK